MSMKNYAEKLRNIVALENKEKEDAAKDSPGYIAEKLSAPSTSPSPSPSKAHKAKPGFLEDRQKHIKGDKRARWVRHDTVPPSEVFVPESHNRDYSRLNEQNCSDLIQGWKETGRQEIAAIVRPYKGENSQYRYELVVGSRRHWVAAFRGENLWVEIRDLTDEEAFRCRDVENRARRDINALERAKELRYALENFYSSQAQMAERLEVSKTWLSRNMALSILPDEVLDAYADPGDMKEIQWREHIDSLKEHLKKDNGFRDRFIDAVKTVKDMQSTLKSKGKQPIQGADVVRRVLRQLKAPGADPRPPPTVYRFENGCEAVRVKGIARGFLKLEVATSRASNDAELMKLIAEAIRDSEV